MSLALRLLALLRPPRPEWTYHDDTYEQPVEPFAIRPYTPDGHRLCPGCGQPMRRCCDSVLGDDHQSSCPSPPA
jgi:hypothetical protein